MILTLTYGDPDPIVRDGIAADLRQILHDRDATLYVDNFIGLGVYLDQPPEHSGVIVADVPMLDTQALFYSLQLSTLRRNVQDVARDWSQDCIGFITSHDTDTLVYSH